MVSARFIKSFEDQIQTLVQDFTKLKDDFFFTEKELHAYFYHLCLEAKVFTSIKGLNLIHSEYPTPFKCKKAPPPDYLIKVDAEELDCIRGHMDIVLLNPNFVEWIKSSYGEDGYKFIKGLDNGSFPVYITSFNKVYQTFDSIHNEPILLYALEFKYLRHTISGTVEPIKEISYDFAKLDLLKNHVVNGCRNSFCGNVQSLIFIGKQSIRSEVKILQGLKTHVKYKVVS